MGARRQGLWKIFAKYVKYAAVNDVNAIRGDGQYQAGKNGARKQSMFSHFMHHLNDRRHSRQTDVMFTRFSEGKNECSISQTCSKNQYWTAITS